MDIIFDIDGTLANIEHRRIYVQSKPRNWKAFNKAIPHDTPILQTTTLLELLYNAGHTILLASGRGEETRQDTLDWLKKYNLDSYVTKLYMRSAKDMRSDDIVKREILAQIREDGFEPFFVVDDRPKVVRMWREEGIFVFDVNQTGEEF